MIVPFVLFFDYPPDPCGHLESPETACPGCAIILAWLDEKKRKS
jgi:hypothetical protein